jgi:hypothetical protein
MRKSLKRIVNHRRKRSSSSSRTYRKKHSHTKRNRKQRGGKTKLEWYREMRKSYGDCDKSKESVRTALSILKLDDCEKFRKLLRIRDEIIKSLSDVVCSDINKIEGTETAYMKPIMQEYGLYTPDSLTNWINFVKYMNRTVSQLALQDLPVVPKAKPSADEWGPAPVEQVPGPQLPEGWTRSGPDHAPIYFTTNGHSLRGEFPTMPAREFEQESAKRGRAGLPDDKQVSAYDRLMAFKDD